MELQDRRPRGVCSGFVLGAEGRLPSVHVWGRAALSGRNTVPTCLSMCFASPRRATTEEPPLPSLVPPLAQRQHTWVGAKGVLDCSAGMLPPHHRACVQGFSDLLLYSCTCISTLSRVAGNGSIGGQSAGHSLARLFCCDDGCACWAALCRPGSTLQCTSLQEVRLSAGSFFWDDYGANDD